MTSPPRCTLRPLSVGRQEEKYAVFLEGAYAGGITVHSIDRPRGVFSYGIAIVPALRRRGVASDALAQLLSRYRTRGFSRCAVDVYADNMPSLALHARLGFVETGRLMKSGRETIRLERAL